MKNSCVVGVGSNIEPKKNIVEALNLIDKDHSIIAVSEFVQTSPIGIKEQADFLNGAIKVLTSLPLEEFNAFLKKVEDQLGRDRALPKFGPRTIDLDVIIWNGKIVDNDYHTRDFLKKSVDEII